jgi:hypothetical protein
MEEFPKAICITQYAYHAGEPLLGARQPARCSCDWMK